jgi:hypothetical protein
VLDVVANSAGAVIGTALGWLIVEAIHRRDARVVARALWLRDRDPHPPG